MVVKMIKMVKMVIILHLNDNNYNNKTKISTKLSKNDIIFRDWLIFKGNPYNIIYGIHYSVNIHYEFINNKKINYVNFY